MSSKPRSDHPMATVAGASGRSVLSREQIITTAIRFIDENGLSALSMRRLAKQLRVEAMSLYRHVNGREDLLEGVVDRLVARLQLRPDQQQLGLADGWQSYLQWLAHGDRALAREHPNAFPLIATRHPAAPWLRPPLRSLDVVDDFLAMLMARFQLTDPAGQRVGEREREAPASSARGQAVGRCRKATASDMLRFLQR